MTKQEFLSDLREALVEEIDESRAEDQVNYYNQYIDSEIAKGRTEEDVVSELGDARMIARNLIDGLEREKTDNTSTTWTQTTYTSEDGSARPQWQEKAKVYGCLGLGLVILFLVIALVTKLFIWMLPSIIVLALIVWIFKQINR